MIKIKDKSKEVFLLAFFADEVVWDSNETQKVANTLATGNYPTGLPDCFVMGTMGQCGRECFVFHNGDCTEPEEFFEHNDTTPEELQQYYDDGLYHEKIVRYCDYKNIEINKG